MLRLTTAARAAALLWPEFVERGGAILLADVRAPDPPAGFPTRTEYERFYGHTHVQDAVRWDVPVVHDAEAGTDVPDPASPEFDVAWAFARRMGEMWLAKLVRDFPRYRFRVYVSRLDDPIVHFHRVRPREPVWISDANAAAQVERDELVIYDSGARTGRRRAVVTGAHR